VITNVLSFWSRLNEVRIAEALEKKFQSFFVILENHSGYNYAAKL
jgi:hypothetical protein